jgi:protein-S-isoprenylcysteine O-methyltransferase Ste14
MITLEGIALVALLGAGLAMMGVYIFPWNSPEQWFCVSYIVFLLACLLLSWLGLYLYPASRNKKKHKK